MKAIKNILSLKRLTAAMVVSMLLVASCQKDNEILDSTDTQNVNSEAASAAFVDESADMGTNVMSDISSTQYSGARVEGDTIKGLGIRDGRLACAKTIIIDRTGSKDSPAGTITIDFGDGTTCLDGKGVRRSGKIIINYSGKRWTPGSWFSIELVNFYRNYAHIEGKETNTTNLSADSLHLQFSSVLVGGKVTFGDGRFITRNHSFTKTWYRFTNASDNIDPTKDEWHVTGSANGTNKRGDSYDMQISDSNPLVHKFSCWLTKQIIIPVKGEKIITVHSSEPKQYTLDYGDGNCDNLITVILGDKQKVINVTGDGN